MDIALIRTFIEVAATGSFANAADRLFVTQSAVSLRVQRLEDTLGQTLFKRSKAGAELTREGQAFEHYALSLTKLWEEARQRVGIPEGFTESLSLGAQYSLWPGLGFRWIDALKSARADLNIRAELGMPDRLTRFLIEGMIQAALIYTPQLRPGLAVEKILEEELVMVAAWPNPDLSSIDGRYVFQDWGPEFVQAHALHLPNLTHTGLTFSLGAMTANFIRGRGLATYVPARSIKPQLDRGELYLVPDAPVFPYPVWAVWRTDLPPDLADLALTTLRQVAQGALSEQDDIIHRLEDISDDPLETLGHGVDGTTT